MEDSGTGRALQCRRSNPNDLSQKDILNHTKNKKAESYKSKKKIKRRKEKEARKES